jgi:hypothetical protein
MFEILSNLWVILFYTILMKCLFRVEFTMLGLLQLHGQAIMFSKLSDCNYMIRLSQYTSIKITWPRLIQTSKNNEQLKLNNGTAILYNYNYSSIFSSKMICTVDLITSRGISSYYQILSFRSETHDKVTI